MLSLNCLKKIMKSPITELFGERLSLLRQGRNLTQEQLSEASGLDRTYISSVERGRRNISLKAIYSLAQAMDVSIEEMFRGLK